MTIAVKVEDFIQYDGTNSAACLARMQDDPNWTWSIFQENASGLVFAYDQEGYPTQYLTPVQVGWWLGKRNPVTGEWAYQWITNEVYEATFKPLALPSAPKLQVGTGVVPLLLASADDEVTVVFPEPFQDTNYSVAPQLISGTDLTPMLEITAGPTIVDEQTVTMTVQNTGLLTLGGYVLVHAVR